MQQRYLLTIHDLFTVRDGVRCGGEAFVAILDDQDEIDRLRFAGMTSPGSVGYRRSYSGRPGLTARLVSGPGRITFEAISSAA
ncbi:TPA: hypothetical protein ACXNF8_001587 [Pseudomonas aeruginosa]|uniref:hypothetical protein n=1 Tax=Pseudomonas aeruginosa TaxID=287 RepID=UPI0026EDBC71|nr:hypothetical protein [Pseudomonas aeruginosa]HEJ4597448.1 hypothetical protein [Pseudomonas aeruginosa]HEJ4859965.1 hypothetical protein [Pseudomonas aeruginosa]